MNIHKLSIREKIGLVLACLFCIIALFDRLVVDPIKQRFAELNNSISVQEKKLARNIRNVEQEEIIKRDYNQHINYLRSPRTDEEELADILSEIEEYARKSRVYLADTKPQAPVEKDFYKVFNVEIEIESEMKNIIDFLYRINKSDKVLRASKIYLKRKSDKTPIIQSDVIISRVVID